jgi:hypothetical protein
MKIRKNGDLRRLPCVRVIGASGEMLGVMDTGDALQLALREGLDLVEVSPKAQPPVCKLLDLSAYKYQDAKRAAKERQGAGLLVFLVRSKLTIRGRPGAFLVGDLVTGEHIRQGMLVCIPGTEGVLHAIPILAIDFVDHRSDGVSELGVHVVGRTPEEAQAVEDLDGPYLLDIVHRPS